MSVLEPTTSFSPTRLLLIEDNSGSMSELNTELKTRHLCVFTLEIARASSEAISAHQPAIVLLEFGERSSRGIERLAALRKEHCRAPVIVLSTGANDWAVEAFQNGAEDYLSSPINVSELIERVNARLRASDERSACAHGLYVDRREGKAFVQNVEVKLTAKEFALLSVLVQHAGYVLSKAHLLETVWGTKVAIRSRTVDQHVRQVRNKLRTLGFPGEIRVVHKRGFALTLSRGVDPTI